MTAREIPTPTEGDAYRLPEQIETGTLLLRRWLVSDVPSLGAAVIANIEHLRPWMPWIAEEPLSEEARRKLVLSWEANWQAGKDVFYGIFRDRAIVGGTGLHRRLGEHGLEIGYWVDSRCIGQGIATEASRALTETALSLPGITFVEIHHDQANLASRRIPEKLGYEFVGSHEDEPTAPGEVGINCVWRMTAEQFSGRQDGYRGGRPVQ
jgi:ribosomal-protein-serine acetyltransferase